MPEYECSECYLVQTVAIIENGLGGFADPYVVCLGCGTIGQFHFAPGTCEKTARMVEDILAATGERTAPALGRLDFARYGTETHEQPELGDAA
jgi:hypothetical protein